MHSGYLENRMSLKPVPGWVGVGWKVGVGEGECMQTRKLHCCICRFLCTLCFQRR